MNCNGYVKIRYHGRYGNKLFTYFIARIYAEEHNLNLIVELDDIFFKIKEPINYGNITNDNLNTYVIHDKDINKNKLPYYGKGIYIFDGYFQFEDIFYENKDKICSFIDLNYKKKDIFTLHIRLDDYFYPNSRNKNYNRNIIVSLDYYVDCIKKYAGNYKDIYIVCDKLRYKWEKKYMDELISKIKLLNKNPIYKVNTINNDIISILQSNYIVTSNSTFCFWAVFFSKAEKIISFPYLGIDVLPNNKLKKWNNDPQIFKYNKNNRFIFNNDYSSNIIDYFQKMY
tara:strand:+ start:4673 stop:5524 length:852 start_codon:yes stop_codon:yes gene_type:complete